MGADSTASSAATVDSEEGAMVGSAAGLGGGGEGENEPAREDCAGSATVARKPMQFAKVAIVEAEA